MNESFPYQVRPARRSEYDEAMALAWRTFLRYEAPEYSMEGVRSFQDFIADNTLYRMFVMGSYPLFVALDGNKVVGMITLRNKTHISLLFVDENYHRQGIGRNLIVCLCNHLMEERDRRISGTPAHAGVEDMLTKVTVNASPYGVGFYHKLGFCDLGAEVERDGIRYTPMVLTL